jgi:hypothetical protein
MRADIHTDFTRGWDLQIPFPIPALKRGRKGIYHHSGTEITEGRKGMGFNRRWTQMDADGRRWDERQLSPRSGDALWGLI